MQPMEAKGGSIPGELTTTEQQNGQTFDELLALNLRLQGRLLRILPAPGDQQLLIFRDRGDRGDEAYGVHRTRGPIRIPASQLSNRIFQGMEPPRIDHMVDKGAAVEISIGSTDGAAAVVSNPTLYTSWEASLSRAKQNAEEAVERKSAGNEYAGRALEAVRKLAQDLPPPLKSG
ncbi:hypothetical protein HYU92_00455 [Candidatus Curtissbacteria bacterium]|nr:hypothetical protein [Candidatus Curtissbacteria bacterium]